MEQHLLEELYTYEKWRIEFYLNVQLETQKDKVLNKRISNLVLHLYSALLSKYTFEEIKKWS